MPEEQLPDQKPGTDTPANLYQTNTPFISKLLVMLFMLFYISMALRLVFDGFVTDHILLKKLLGTPAGEEKKLLFSNAAYSMLGALLGCGVYDMISFHKYVAVMKRFEKEHIWGYFFAPFLSLSLGLIVYGLLKTGLLVFTGSVTNDNLDTARLGYLTIGFLAGFGWYKLIQKIKKLIDELFGSGSASKKEDESVTEAIKKTPSVSEEAVTGK